MSCYRICQADLTCTCIHIYSNNVQICDERLKVRQSHNPKANANVLCCYISLSCTCIHLYILVSTLVTPDFFSRFLFVTPQFLFCLSEH